MKFARTNSTANNQNACADERIIADLDCVIDQQTHAGPCKNDLYKNRSAHQASEAHTQNGYRRN